MIIDSMIKLSEKDESVMLSQKKLGIVHCSLRSKHLEHKSQYETEVAN